MAPFRRLSIPSRTGHSPGKAETLHLQSPRMLPGRLSTAPSPPGPCNSCKLQAAPVPAGGRANVLQQKAGRRGPGGKPLSPCRWLPHPPVQQEKLLTSLSHIIGSRGADSPWMPAMRAAPTLCSDISPRRLFKTSPWKTTLWKIKGE